MRSGGRKYGKRHAQDFPTCIDALTMIDLESGKSFSTSDLEDKVVIIEFWKIHCGACRKHLTELNEIKSRRKDWIGRVHALTAASQPAPEILRRLLAFEGWDALRHCGYDFSTFPLKTIPRIVLIDPDGNVVFAGHPKDANTEAVVDAMLDDEPGDTCMGIISTAQETSLKKLNG